MSSGTRALGNAVEALATDVAQMVADAEKLAELAKPAVGSPATRATQVRREIAAKARMVSGSHQRITRSVQALRSAVRALEGRGSGMERRDRPANLRGK